MSPEPAKWIATILTIIAAVLVASDLGRRITGYGFVVFSVGSAAWIVASLLDAEAPLALTNLVMLPINLLGVYRWLIVKSP